ncbi:DUF3172 domain-containing protein [Pleurocapsa sp. PCC 7319]|uniref:DUF3172 domain-containing protein n=1 Tax=Pleurocapsa sp. PCC 7319 TaxID=118161 RepID=UPI0003454F0B|nr:DUF3172 domain-containing protein [Pleurocapsa sp. PCC 7319]
MTRRNRDSRNRDSRNRDNYNRYDPPSYRQSNPIPPKDSPINVAKAAILASVFVVGVVVGLALNLTTSSNPTTIDSSLQIDRKAPNPEICQQFGASAIVTDMRVFLTLTPFSVYLTQPRMQPGCVLRRTNWAVLEQKKLVNSEQVRDCKRRMNTFGFIGTLEGNPKIDCVYQNDAAGNLFLAQPGSGVRPETDNF